MASLSAESRRDIFFLAGLFLITFAVYGNTLGNGFVLDDEALIVNNPLVKSPSLWLLNFKTALYDYPELNPGKIPFNKMYRPLQTLSYIFDYRLWGLNPSGFHLTNILLHASNAMLVFYICLLLFNRAIARVAGLLFAVHPLHVSVVSYISARSDLLVCLCILTSMILFLYFISMKSKWYYLLSLFFAATALVCRESALLLPLFIILLLYLQRDTKFKWLWVVPFLLLNIVYLGLRFILFGRLAVSIHTQPAFLSLALRLMNFLNIIPRYLSLLMVPKESHLFRSVPFVTQPFSQDTALALAVLLGIAYLVFRFRRNKPLVFASLWFLIGLLPVFFFLDAYRGISAQAMMAESWVYLSSIGFFVFVGSIVPAWQIGRIGFILVSTIYAFGTIRYNATWHDSLSLYRNALQYLPQRNTVRKNLILEYLKLGLYESALKEIQQFSRDYPESSLRYVLLGRYDYALGHLSQAIENFETALAMNKNSYEIYYRLGLCFAGRGEREEAREAFSHSLVLNPRYFDSLLALGDLYAQEEECVQALGFYQRALAIDPSDASLQEKIRLCQANR
ncbi:MAG: hypothetical protein AMJ95_05445 [Omnitrophica WOR_2 bacterium SM23_72]|nr:MAG: hypothetical protein AMJ95_05445 [Omnitrophica WOR_2 bacterium SM23_72]